MKQVVKDILTDLETNPERWNLACATWLRDDGVQVWRANMPMLDISLYTPVSMRFSLVEKFKLWRAFRKWNAARTLDFIAKGGRI